MNRDTLKDAVFMRIAREVSLLSTCSRADVGCALTDMGREQVWVGYNGSPRGLSNECIRDEAGRCGCIHAEVNAALKADARIAKRAYCTLQPCERCAAVLVNARVEWLMYDESYRDSAGLDLLHRAGVVIRRATPV